MIYYNFPRVSKQAIAIIHNITIYSYRFRIVYWKINEYSNILDTYYCARNFSSAPIAEHRGCTIIH